MVKPMFLNESVLRQDMDLASTMNVDLQRFMYRKKGFWSVPEARNMKIPIIYFTFCVA